MNLEDTLRMAWEDAEFAAWAERTNYGEEEYCSMEYPCPDRPECSHVLDYED